MQGHRVLPNSKGLLDRELMRIPGSYGKPTFDFVAKYGPNCARMSWWEVVAPDGSSCVLNPDVHTVVEHDDLSITVHPSIVTSTWHGWLERGVWRSV